ncbi:MAG: FecR domain-containing protein [Chitinophagaceae bacterium]
MIDEKIWLLVSLSLSGEATTAEKEELQSLLAEYPQLAERVAVYEKIWQSRAAGNTNAGISRSYDKHLQRLSNHLSAPALQYEEDYNKENKINAGHKKTRVAAWIAAAASIAAAVVLWVMMGSSQDKANSPSPKIATNTVSTKPGSKSKIELPDGTQVWLNADSKLEYSGDFSGKLREVKLSGEAYFDVVKDKSRPFIIHTIAAQVKVLGTAFNVRSYAADKTTETSLIRGSVEVTLNGQPDKKVILKPNEKVIISHEGVFLKDSTVGNKNKVSDDDRPASMTVQNVHLDKKDKEVYETMWVKNKLAFDETPFDNMIAEIERWYNVSIQVKNKNLSANTYTVTFENKTLDEVLEGLQFSAHFQYQVKNGVVTIW